MNSQAKGFSTRTREMENELRLIEETEKTLVEKVDRIEEKLNAHELDRKVKALQETATETHLALWFGSEGAAPTSIVMRLQEIGFKPTKGKYDFVYDWKRRIALKEVFKLGDTVSKTLKGSKVLYKLVTV